LLRKELDKYPGKLVALGVGYGKFTKDEQDSWAKAKKDVKIDWPVIVDEDESYVKQLFPKAKAERPAYIFFDKTGKRLEFLVTSPDEFPKLVARLVNQ
jgi:hypothetical protein